MLLSFYVNIVDFITRSKEAVMPDNTFALPVPNDSHDDSGSEDSLNLFNSQTKLKVPEGMMVATEVGGRNPPFLVFINLFIPFVVLALGISTALFSLGLISSSAIFGLPFGIGVFALAGILGAIAWFGPRLVQWYRNRTGSIPPTNPPEYLYEVKPKLFGPTVVSSLSWDLRVTMAAAGFALLAVVIALLILNPAGIVAGTSILHLIAMSAVPLSFAAVLGAIVGFVVGVKYRDFALRWTQQNAKKIPGTDIIDPDELMIIGNGPERSIFRGSKHSLFIGGSVMGGLFLGTTVAAVTALFTGGFAVVPFCTISLSVMGLVIAYPYLSAAWDWVLGRFGYKRAYKYDESRLAAQKEAVRAAVLSGNATELAAAVTALNAAAKEIKEAKDAEVSEAGVRVPIIPAGLDFPFWFNLFLGLAVGLSFAAMFGSLIGPLTILVAPITFGALAVLSPTFSKYAGPTLRWIAVHLGLSKQAHHNKSPDIVWPMRLFNGTSAAVALMGASIALGSGLPVSIAIGALVAGLALFSPTLFAVWRNFFPSTAPEPTLIKDSDGKPKGFVQWHVRIVLGTIFASLATIAFPVVGPYLIIACAVAFVALPPLYDKFVAPRVYSHRSAASPPLASSGTGREGVEIGVAVDKRPLSDAPRKRGCLAAIWGIFGSNNRNNVLATAGRGAAYDDGIIADAIEEAGLAVVGGSAAAAARKP